MHTKVSNAIARLDKILPLAQRQQQLGSDIADVYQRILLSYVERGTSLSKDEMAQHVGDIEQAIATLKQYDMVVFDDNDEPTGTYPFTMEQREHKVTFNGHTVHCMCALDALAVAPMFGLETDINSRCHLNGDTITIHQNSYEIIEHESVADVYFGISWNAAANNCCASSLCTEMIFLKGTGHAGQWRLDDPDNREIFNLDDAVEFAAGFFTPLVSRPAA